jgi:NSS family neurotransmitter:Na+ symporter
MKARKGFTSSTGFILAAAGSAVGLGNIWSFPTQTASNGGGAFVLVYFIMAFCLAYPALMAELVIGRYAQANMVTALGSLSSKGVVRKVGAGVGIYGVVVASLILSFYAIVAGWMVAFLFESVSQFLGLNELSLWLTTFGLERNILFMLLFMVFTMAIVAKGVESGIEKWSTRLMPVLIVIMFALIIYVLMQKGAVEGLRVYLLPDLSQISPALILSAMGQAFFSLSLGVGAMLVYGSYLSKEANLPKMGAAVTLLDSGIAFVAGLLIIPAVYVAKEHGADIFTAEGDLITGPDLIFQVLPSLFQSMGAAGAFVAFAFFTLMSIASLTSSISMLEVPVTLFEEETSATRLKATLIIGGVISLISTIIVLNFNALFTLVINFTTVYSQPILGVLLCVFAGWIWRRDSLLAELKQGNDGIENSFFWKVWPVYVRFLCPVFIIAAFIQSVVL